MKGFFKKKRIQFLDEGKMNTYCKSRCKNNTSEKCYDQCKKCSKTAMKYAHKYAIDDIALRPVTTKQETTLKKDYEKFMNSSNASNDENEIKYAYHRWGKCIRDNCAKCSKKEQAENASDLFSCVDSDYESKSNEFINKMCTQQACGNVECPDNDVTKKSKENCVKQRNSLLQNYNKWMQKSLENEGDSKRILSQKSAKARKNYSIELGNTNAADYDYVLVSCFTGWGTASVKFINEYTKNVPNMSVCKQLFPSSSLYSVESLNKAVDDYYLNK